MNKLLILALLTTIIIESVWIYEHSKPQNPVNPPKPLLSYTFENLRKTKLPASEITLGTVISQNSDYISRLFYYYTPSKPNSKNMLKISGVINIPSSQGPHPVIIMFRGYIPSNSYSEGAGTQPSAESFAKNGFITLAPDFLGFGQSASGSANGFENRFQTYTTALSLLASIKNLNKSLSLEYGSKIQANLTKIGIWGHSNGGHIALATLAISGVKYPTVLWAPVSTSFPYSILFFTNESEDRGKALRKAVAGFESLYNSADFSPDNFYKYIKAPILVNQGLNDEEVPYWWSQNLVTTLTKDDISAKLITYPNSDHNFLPDGWSSAVTNSISFFKSQFSQ